MNFIKRLPIRLQLILLISCVVIVMFFMVIFTYFEVARIVTDKNEKYNSKIIYQVKNNISANCDVINRIAFSIAYNETVQEYLVENDPLTKYNMYNKLVNLFDKMVNIKEGIIDIVIISKEGNTFDLNGLTGFCKQFEDSIPFKDNGDIYYTKHMPFEKIGMKGDCIIACAKVFSIDSMRKYGQKVGTVYIVLDPKAVINENYYKSDEDGTYIYLLDRSKNVFFNNNGPLLGTKFIGKDEYFKKDVNYFKDKVENEECMIQVEEIAQLEGWIVCITPMKKLLYDVDVIRSIEIYIFIIALLFIILPFTIITNNITSPLKKLVSFMTGVSSGNLKRRIGLNGYAEMNIMVKEFNSMLDEIDKLTHRLIDTNSMLYKAELEKKQSELAFLRSQINPHFLYNTFESIKGIAAVKGVPEIKDMTTALSNVFRYSIKGAALVLLRDEVNIIKSYLLIQQIRFQDRFEIVYEFDEKILDYQIPKMILQPIVENSIFHGLEPKLDKGHLWIGGRMSQNGDILLWVRDDGVGIADDDLINIVEKLTHTNKKDGQNQNEYYSIGLENVNNRIRLSYGERYGIELSSSQGEYTQILIKLPSRWDGYV